MIAVTLIIALLPIDNRLFCLKSMFKKVFKPPTEIKIPFGLVRFVHAEGRAAVGGPLAARGSVPGHGFDQKILVVPYSNQGGDRGVSVDLDGLVFFFELLPLVPRKRNIACVRVDVLAKDICVGLDDGASLARFR